jgi:AsmA protein
MSKGNKKQHSVTYRVLKWCGITIGTIIVLIIIAIIVIPHVVNTGAVKHKIESVATQKTGRQITIAGPLSLSLFPWIGFDAEDVTMANAKGFDDQPFMHVKEAKLHAKLIPLIFGTVEVSGITFDSPVLHLAKQKNGRDNWQDLTGEKGGKKSGNANQGKSSPLAQLSIGHININDAQLTYDDAQAGKHYAIDKFGLEASHLAPNNTFPLTFSTLVSSSDPHFKADIKFDTQARFDKTGDNINLTKGDLSAKITNFGGSKPVHLGAQWKSITLDNNAGTADISDLLLTLADLKAQLNAKATQLQGKPEISGHLNVPEFSPRKVLSAISEPVPGSLKGFNKASLHADLKGKPNALSLTNLVLKLDSSTLKGNAGIPDLDRGGVHFDLALDHIDLSDYIASGGGEKVPVGAAHSEAFMKTRLPASMLKGIDANGKLTIGKLSGFGLDANQVHLGLDAASGKVSLKPLSAKLYSGTYSGHIDLAAAGQGISLDTTENLKNIELGGLIKAFAGNDKLSGTSNLNLSLSGKGKTVGELLNMLKGNVDFSIKDGTLHGIDLWDSLHRAYALVKEHKKLPEPKGPKQTKITNLQAHSVIKQGKFTTDTLVARLPFLAVTGHGSIDFMKKDGVDYRLIATVVKTPKISGEDIAKLKSAEVPMRIHGSLTDLSVYPDIEDALKARAKSEVKKKLDEKKQELLDKLRKDEKGKNGQGVHDKGKDLLRQLLGGGHDKNKKDEKEKQGSGSG